MILNTNLVKLGESYNASFSVRICVDAAGIGGTFANCMINIYDEEGAVLWSRNLGDLTVHAGECLNLPTYFASTSVRPQKVEVLVHNAMYSATSYFRQSSTGDIEPVS